MRRFIATVTLISGMSTSFYYPRRLNLKAPMSQKLFLWLIVTSWPSFHFALWVVVTPIIDRRVSPPNNFGLPKIWTKRLFIFDAKSEACHHCSTRNVQGESERWIKNNMLLFLSSFFQFHSTLDLVSIGVNGISAIHLRLGISYNIIAISPSLWFNRRLRWWIKMRSGSFPKGVV